MIYIDIDRLERRLLDTWQQRAQEAQEYVRSASPTERSQAINKYNDVWSSLKADLKEISHGKCWYCETFTNRTSGDVDHHRPKNEVEGCPNHPGYWWLAFEWRNFRYSCEFCNRRRTDPVTQFVGGKGTYFPLLNAEERIADECEYEELLVERPFLLDPIDVEDPSLLTFDPDGTARPAKKEEDSPEEYQRAKTSIDLYHLNHTDLKKRRQLDIGYKIHKLVRIANLNRKKYEKDKSKVEAYAAYKEATKELKRMMHEEHEYSATAKAVLRTHNTNRNAWLEPLLSA